MNSFMFIGLIYACAPNLGHFLCEINFPYRRYEFSENRDYFLCDIYIVQ